MTGVVVTWATKDNNWGAEQWRHREHWWSLDLGNTEPKAHKTLGRQVSNTSPWWVKTEKESLQNENQLLKTWPSSVVHGACQVSCRLSLRNHVGVPTPFLSRNTFPYPWVCLWTAPPADTKPWLCSEHRYVFLQCDPEVYLLTFHFGFESPDRLILTVIGISHLVHSFLLANINMYLFSRSTQSPS